MAEEEQNGMVRGSKGEKNGVTSSSEDKSGKQTKGSKRLNIPSNDDPNPMGYRFGGIFERHHRGDDIDFAMPWDYKLMDKIKRFGYDYGMPANPKPTNMAQKIYAKTLEIAKLLVEKNQKYGNSALAPINVFHKGDPIEGIKIRIDDKLKRIAMGNIKDTDEDTLMDLAGYIVLLMIALDDQNAETPKRR